jgi:Ca2+-transporting ATPase
MCYRIAGPAGPETLDPDTVHAAASRMAAAGLRVLAMAVGSHRRGDGPSPDLEDPRSLVLVGLVGMLDPAREGVREAIASCRDAGVRVVMITGDHALTAEAVARQIQLAPEPTVLSGEELEQLEDDALGIAVRTTDVYARVAPEQKLRIVRALQANSEVVAVTGDGVNDAPALKAAAIGVAMGRTGTDVAREAADIVLADDDFVTIVAAVEEGRVTFDNVRKATAFLVTTAVATIIAILVAVGLQWPLLMLPAQLLWLNLVTNGLQDVALAFERGEPGVMRRMPRRPDAGVLDSVLWIRTVLVGTVMAVGALALFRWELDTTGSPELARTVALSTIVVAMAFHAGSSRSHDRSVFAVSPGANVFLSVATAATLALHAAALYLPFTQYVLRVEPLSPQAWLRVVLVASLVLVVSETDKAVRRWLSGRGRAD